MDRRTKVDIAVVAAGLGLYAANRFAGVFDATPLALAARYHLGDLCGGLVFPACVNLFEAAICAPDKYRFRGPARVYALAALCSLAWEGLAPLVLFRSTADVLDVAAYFLGASVYLLAGKAFAG